MGHKSSTAPPPTRSHPGTAPRSPCSAACRRARRLARTACSGASTPSAEPLTAGPSDPAVIENAIVAIVADTDAAFDPDALWPAHEWDGCEKHCH